MKKENELLTAALTYCEKFNFSVIPVGPNKRALLPWTEFQKRRPSPGEIEQWWTKWPGAMIGIITGKISGIVVVDIDSKSGREAIARFIPDEILRPMAETPRGGEHWYFRCPDPAPGNNAGAIPGCDLRAEGGYIIAPPSKNGTGKGYAWCSGFSLDEQAPPALPALYQERILININNSLYKGGEVTGEDSDFNRLQPTSSDFKMFQEGTRDNDLFHIANCLIKGHAQPEEARQVLEILAKNCIPPFSEKEIQSKILSAMQRADKREINFAQEVRDFVVTSSGFFLTSDVFNRLQVTSRQDKKNVVLSLLRLHKEGLIERQGQKDGCYRRIDKNFERVDFLAASGDEFKIELPLGIGELGKLYPGNIVVIAGSKEAGKSAFLFNLAHANLGKRRIVYLNSEMGPDEFRNRLLFFNDTPLGTWAEKMEVFYLKSTQTPADFIDGSPAIWIVDYLEIAEDFSKIAIPIAAIHEKLGKGVAFVGLQKADGRDVGRGDAFSREKARLYISLDWDQERRLNRVKIIDCKAWRSKNPRGLVRFYKLVHGAQILPQTEWE